MSAANEQIPSPRPRLDPNGCRVNLAVGGTSSVCHMVPTFLVTPNARALCGASPTGEWFRIWEHVLSGAERPIALCADCWAKAFGAAGTTTA